MYDRLLCFVYIQLNEPRRGISSCLVSSCFACPGGNTLFWGSRQSRLQTSRPFFVPSFILELLPVITCLLIHRVEFLFPVVFHLSWYVWALLEGGSICVWILFGGIAKTKSEVFGMFTFMSAWRGRSRNWSIGGGGVR